MEPMRHSSDPLGKAAKRLTKVDTVLVCLRATFIIAVVGIGCARKDQADSEDLEARAEFSLLPSVKVGHPLAPDSAADWEHQRLEDEINRAVDRLRDAIRQGTDLDPNDVQAVKDYLATIEDPEKLTFFAQLPFWLFPELGSEILETVESVLTEYEYSSARYFKAIDVLNRASNIATTGEILLRELEKMPDFHYPETPPPVRAQSFWQRGAFGYIAQAVVRNGNWNPEVMEKYWTMLEQTESTDRKRVLVWALGESNRYEDFERLYESIYTVENEDEILVREKIITLHRMTRSMASYGMMDPEDEPDLARVPLDPERRRPSLSEMAADNVRAIEFLKEVNLFDPYATDKY